MVGGRVKAREGGREDGKEKAGLLIEAYVVGYSMYSLVMTN